MSVIDLKKLIHSVHERTMIFAENSEQASLDNALDKSDRGNIALGAIRGFRLAAIAFRSSCAENDPLYPVFDALLDWLNQTKTLLCCIGRASVPNEFHFDPTSLMAQSTKEVKQGIANIEKALQDGQMEKAQTLYNRIWGLIMGLIDAFIHMYDKDTKDFYWWLSDTESAIVNLYEKAKET